MLHVVCYDISNDAMRSRLSRRLLDFGVRIQESVFECVLTEELFGRMMGVLRRLPLAESDRVRVYRVCGSCVERVEIYGLGEVTEDPAFYLV